jgi:uncharacterized membrane protein (DUF2068 family)
MQKTDRRMIRGIALFKLAKAAVLLSFGVAALRLVNTDIGALLGEWVPRIGLGPASRVVGRALLEATALTPTRIREVGLGGLVYAGLFLTEGLGLWFLKRWAEWMTIVLTSSLIPVEIWEIFRHPRWIKVLVLLVNAALVGYLVWVVKKERGEVGEGEQRH